MAADAWAIFHAAKEAMLDGTLDLDVVTANTFKCALIASSWTPALSTDTLWSGISANEIAAVNGYTAGGQGLTAVTLTSAAGTTTWDSADLSWAASGGSITARYAAIYHVASGQLICHSLLDNTPADHTAADATSFVIQQAAGGIFSLS